MLGTECFLKHIYHNIAQLSYKIIQINIRDHQRPPDSRGAVHQAETTRLHRGSTPGEDHQTRERQYTRRRPPDSRGAVHRRRIPPDSRGQYTRRRSPAESYKNKIMSHENMTGGKYNGARQKNKFFSFRGGGSRPPS